MVRRSWRAPATTGDAPFAAATPGAALAELAPAATAVVDLADEPVLRERARLELAALALHLGLDYEAPGIRLTPPPAPPAVFDGRTLAVIGTGKRTGKTAVAGHWARLIAEAGGDPVIVAIGRGGPAEPVLASPGTTIEDLERIAAGGAHAASDYLENAVLAEVPAVGARRVGGGPAGEPADDNVAAAVELAALQGADTLIVEGSGASLPPVGVDRCVCVVGDPGDAHGLGRLRLLRADLVLVRASKRLSGAIPFELVAEPAEPIPANARVAMFTTGGPGPRGLEPVFRSTALARRGELARDLDRAAAEGCDVYLTELKAAAIDTVATRARVAGARIVLMRNRPAGPGLDEALVRLWRG